MSDGGPAFPTGDGVFGGMSLRDWFAGQALVGLMSQMSGVLAMYDTDDPEQATTVAFLAYKAADAMLKKRAQ